MPQGAISDAPHKTVLPKQEENEDPWIAENNKIIQMSQDASDAPNETLLPEQEENGRDPWTAEEDERLKGVIKEVGMETEDVGDRMFRILCDWVAIAEKYNASPDHKHRSLEEIKNRGQQFQETEDMREAAKAEARESDMGDHFGVGVGVGVMSVFVNVDGLFKELG